MALTDWIPAIGSGISGLFNVFSQNSANKTNMKIAQMNNQWSEKMMDKQNQFNIDAFNRESAFTKEMWNANNEYNTPQAQAERFRRAGLNPALMMGSANAGTAQAVSAPHGNSVGLPSPQGTQVQPINYSGITDGIIKGVEVSAMLARNQAEVNNLNTQSDVAKARARADIEKMREETRNVKFKNDLNDITRDLQLTQMNEDYLQTVQNRINMEQQDRMWKVQTALMNKELQAFDERLQMDIAVQMSQIELNKYNAQEQGGKIIDTLEKKGYKLSKQDKKRIFDAIFDYAINQGLPNSMWTTINRGYTDVSKNVRDFIRR